VRTAEFRHRKLSHSAFVTPQSLSAILHPRASLNSQIGAAFLADVDSTDLKPWLSNGVGTPEKPGDLGYWVGYCIAKKYYRRAHNKRAAMQTLLEVKDPKRILTDSGWKPGDRG
jgi:hypothetical protein